MKGAPLHPPDEAWSLRISVQDVKDSAKCAKPAAHTAKEAMEGVVGADVTA